MNFIALAWSLVLPLTIEKCFKRAGISEDNIGTELDDGDDSDDDIEPYEGISDEDWLLLQADGTFRDYITVDEEVETTAKMSIDDILESRFPESSDEEETEETEPTRSTPTLTSALRSFEELRAFLSTSDDVDRETQALLNAVRRKVFLVHEKKSKQPKLTDFFAHQTKN